MTTTPPPTTGQAGAVVQARLIGDEAAIGALADALRHADGIDVIGTTGPRPCRYDPGVRVYLTVAVHEEAPR